MFLLCYWTSICLWESFVNLSVRFVFFFVFVFVFLCFFLQIWDVGNALRNVDKKRVVKTAYRSNPKNDVQILFFYQHSIPG